MAVSGSWVGSKLPKLPSSEGDFDEEPVNSIRFTYGDFQLVGHGEVTNDYCGKFRGHLACSRVELHDRVALDGQNFRGKVYRKPVFYSCYKPSCPKCYKWAWAVRQAGRIEARLKEASKRFGLVEHLIVGIPSKFWALSYEELRRKCRDALQVRGIIGGAEIFYAFRYERGKGWYWSPHFHVLGFILGGYGKCRGCKKCVRGCNGFVDRNYRLNETDGIYVKVKGKRKSVGGTAWYLLHHSTIDVTKKRFHVVRWWGVASYRKLKVTVEYKKAVCKLCGHDLVLHYYFGKKRFALDRDSPDFERESFEDYEEDGQPVWFEKESKWYG